jgi:hypothetical protein
MTIITELDILTYSCFDELIRIGTCTHGHRNDLSAGGLAGAEPFGLLGKERGLEDSGRCHCYCT